MTGTTDSPPFSAEQVNRVVAWRVVGVTSSDRRHRAASALVGPGATRDRNDGLARVARQAAHGERAVLELRGALAVGQVAGRAHFDGAVDRDEAGTCAALVVE